MKGAFHRVEEAGSGFQGLLVLSGALHGGLEIAGGWWVTLVTCFRTWEAHIGWHAESRLARCFDIQ
ncbi:hypothetical protein ACG83_23660 [Frankia sp. R43]|nr:hypothetical protein ACG83_23660 [Frankia sp. R43]